MKEEEDSSLLTTSVLTSIQHVFGHNRKIPKRYWEPTNNYKAAILHASLSLTCPPTRCEFCGWCPALFTRGLNQTWHRICTTEGKAWFSGNGILTSNVQDVAEEQCVCSRYFRSLGEDEVIDSVTLTDCLQRTPEYKWAPSLWRT